MRPGIIFRLTLITLLVAACGGSGVSPSSFLQPQVDLRQVKLRSAGITGGTLDAQLAIANPNHLEVKGAKVTAGWADMASAAKNVLGGTVSVVQ